jgi:hypothetical protein
LDLKISFQKYLVSSSWYDFFSADVSVFTAISFIKIKALNHCISAKGYVIITTGKKV